VHSGAEKFGIFGKPAPDQSAHGEPPLVSDIARERGKRDLREMQCVW